jgi:hypothetical protein
MTMLSVQRYIYIPLRAFSVKIYFRHLHFEDLRQISIGYFLNKFKMNMNDA